MKVLCISGSLRKGSSNQVLLNAWARLAPLGVEAESFGDLGELPLYNPDIDCDPLPKPVIDLREKVAAADALLIASPEYIHALPAACKNLLEWLVSDTRFTGKRVGVLQVDRGSSWAYDSLLEVLRTMSADVVEDACTLLPLSTNRVVVEDILGDPRLVECLQENGRALAG